MTSSLSLSLLEPILFFELRQSLLLQFLGRTALFFILPELGESHLLLALLLLFLLSAQFFFGPLLYAKLLLSLCLFACQTCSFLLSALLLRLTTQLFLPLPLIKPGESSLFLLCRTFAVLGRLETLLDCPETIGVHLHDPLRGHPLQRVCQIIRFLTRSQGLPRALKGPVLFGHLPRGCLHQCLVNSCQLLTRDTKPPKYMFHIMDCGIHALCPKDLQIVLNKGILLAGDGSLQRPNPGCQALPVLASQCLLHVRDLVAGNPERITSITDLVLADERFGLVKVLFDNCLAALRLLQMTDHLSERRTLGKGNVEMLLILVAVLQPCLRFRRITGPDSVFYAVDNSLRNSSALLCDQTGKFARLWHVGIEHLFLDRLHLSEVRSVLPDLDMEAAQECFRGSIKLGRVAGMDPPGHAARFRWGQGHGHDCQRHNHDGEPSWKVRQDTLWHTVSISHLGTPPVRFCSEANCPARRDMWHTAVHAVSGMRQLFSRLAAKRKPRESEI